jgi:hypothetical protein
LLIAARIAQMNPAEPPSLQPGPRRESTPEAKSRGGRKAWLPGLGFVLVVFLVAANEQCSRLSMSRGNPVVAAALAQAAQNPQVVAAFGKPIHIQWSSFTQECPQCDRVHFTFDVAGPSANGEMLVIGDRSSLGPTLQRVYLRPSGGEIIDVVGSHLVKHAR